ncbi:gamma-glutamyl kinase [Paracoccus sp. NGMCC 1.201697]|uniref:Gamma-glutamyl kinase n=1 Tax=Paracoccus broussonetiae subsp. drimophilus TaxID=3373869 RepID=A0ABW7LKC4_9RHOB
MLIFIEPRLVLLSVPKTGTTALEQALLPHAEISFRSRPEIKHINHRQYLKQIRPLLAPLGHPSFDRVAVIREPLDWLRSWYRYRARDALIGHPNSTAQISFEQFLRDYLSEGERPAHARLGRQSDFLLDATGRISIQHLYRYEALPELVRFLSQRIGVPISLGRSNVSPEAATDLDPKAEVWARAALAREYEVWEGARQAAPYNSLARSSNARTMRTIAS